MYPNTKKSIVFGASKSKDVLKTLSSLIENEPDISKIYFISA